MTEKIIFLLFDKDGFPFSVETYDGSTRTTYDFEMSKRYGLLYTISAGGALYPISVFNQEYWAAPEIHIEEHGECKRLEVLPERYSDDHLFQDAMSCEGLVYCSLCDDWMPDYSSCLCAHVWFCKKCNIMSTPDNRCIHGFMCC